MSNATLLDNHDMHRFLWLAEDKKERLKLAAVCQMTLEGTPIVYYGTEVGLSQYDDAHKENALARAPMLWNERQDTDLLAFYQRVIALRTSHAALRHGKRVTLAIDVQGEATQKEQVGGYLRVLGQERIIVLLNNSDKAVDIRIPLRGTLIPKDAKLSAITLHHLLMLDNEQRNDVPGAQNSISEFSLAPFGAFVGVVLIGTIPQSDL
jgi:glycosidase